jgi:hypothetical protein
MPLWRKDDAAPDAPEPEPERVWSAEFNAIVEEIRALSLDDLVQVAANVRRQVEASPSDERLVLRADLAQDELNRRSTAHASAGWEPRVPTEFAG